MNLADIKRRHGRDWSSLQRMHGTDGAQLECPLILRDRGQLIAEVERLTVALSDTQERYTAVAVAEKKIAEKAEAEVQRLTALCDGYRGEVEAAQWSTNVLAKEVKRLLSALTRARAEGMEEAMILARDYADNSFPGQEAREALVALAQELEQAAIRARATKGDSDEG